MYRVESVTTWPHNEKYRLTWKYELWYTIVLIPYCTHFTNNWMKWSYNYYFCFSPWRASIRGKKGFATKKPFEFLLHSQSEDTLLWCAIWEWFPHEINQITDSHVAAFFLRFLRLFKHFTAVRFVWNCPGLSKGIL